MDMITFPTNKRSDEFGMRKASNEMASKLMLSALAIFALASVAMSADTNALAAQVFNRLCGVMSKPEQQTACKSDKGKARESFLALIDVIKKTGKQPRLVSSKLPEEPALILVFEKLCEEVANATERANCAARAKEAVALYSQIQGDAKLRPILEKIESELKAGKPTPQADVNALTLGICATLKEEKQRTECAKSAHEVGPKLEGFLNSAEFKALVQNLESGAGGGRRKKRGILATAAAVGTFIIWAGTTAAAFWYG